MVVPDDERCHPLVCALKQIGMCEAEHSTRNLLTAIPAAKSETSALGQSGRHDKFEQCPYLNTGRSPLNHNQAAPKKDRCFESGCRCAESRTGPARGPNSDSRQLEQPTSSA